MLHERIERLPAEALGQLLGADGLVAELQLMEDALQRQSHRLGGVVRLSRHLVNGPAELVSEIQRLEEGVHVAGGALVLQTHITYQTNSFQFFYLTTFTILPLFPVYNNHKRNIQVTTT